MPIVPPPSSSSSTVVDWVIINSRYLPFHLDVVLDTHVDSDEKRPKFPFPSAPIWPSSNRGTARSVGRCLPHTEKKHQPVIIWNLKCLNFGDTSQSMASGDLLWSTCYSFSEECWKSFINSSFPGTQTSECCKFLPNGSTFLRSARDNYFEKKKRTVEASWSIHGSFHLKWPSDCIEPLWFELTLVDLPTRFWSKLKI